MKARLFVVIGIVFVFAALSFGVITAQDAEPADVRVFHAASGWDRHDFYLNDQYIGTVGYGEAADYMLVAPGEVTLKVVEQGAPLDGDLTFEGTFTAESGQHLTVAPIGPQGGVVLNVLEINRTPLELGQSRVRVIHAVSDGGSTNLSLTNAAGEATVLAEGVGMAENGATVLPAGAYTLTAEGVLADAPLAFNARNMVMVYVFGTADGSKPIKAIAFPSQTVLDGPSGVARFVHAIPDGPAVDMYLNGTLVVANWGFGGRTLYMPLEPGSYEVAYYAAGSGMEGDPIMTQTLDVADGDSFTAVAMLSNGTPSVQVFADDRTAAPDNQGKVMVINAQSDPIDVTVDGATALSALEWGQLSAGFVLPGGKHDLAIVAGGTALDIWEGYEILPNTATKLRTLVVTDGGIITLLSRSLAG